MCGICGKLNFDPEAPVRPELVSNMLGTIRHRGPDGEGTYFSGQAGLGHRRLSIIDLNRGQQPLANEDGSIWVVFNGEIYNYQELRTELLQRGHVFKTDTDTEVLVHLYEDLGPEFLHKLRGMFAFAIWDDKKKELMLARDRVGIKPLYYHVSRTSIIFASEIKALLVDPELKPEIRPEMIDRFLTFLYMPGEDTLLKGVTKLAPGTYLVAGSGGVQIRRYWDLHFPAQTANRSLKVIEEQVEELLAETVKLHMISDVPVGVLLSGGVDSTAILSFVAEMAEPGTRSFTVGFSQLGARDERPFARLAAETYGTKHHEITISANEFAEFLPKYVWHMEEPVCEPPAIALHYVTKLAREYVKVLISGEGGDEAFAGYGTYKYLMWLERIKKALGPFQEAGATSLRALNSLVQSGKVAKYLPLMNKPLESYYHGVTCTPRFSNYEISDLYSDSFNHHVDRSASFDVVRNLPCNGESRDSLSRMLYVDTRTWLPDDLLVKADKMTMANSVELRVPFLDHKVLEFAAGLPSSVKVRGGSTKYILKRALGRRIPKEIIARKKAGFPVPYESWLRNELGDWVRSVLCDSRTVSRGYFTKSKVEALLAKDSEVGGYSKEIFSLLVLELWHRTFLDRELKCPLECALS